MSRCRTAFYPMKTIFFLLFLLFLLTGFANRGLSQDFKYGLQAGLDVTDVNAGKALLPDNNIYEYFPMVSYNINGYLEMKKKKFIGFAAEPGFIQKGGIQKRHNENIRYQENYIQMPMTVNFYIFKKLCLSIGLEPDYLINIKTNLQDEYNYTYISYNYKLETSAVAGISYNVFGNCDVGIRYSHGLSISRKLQWHDLYNADMGTSTEYNFYYQLYLRYRI